MGVAQLIDQLRESAGDQRRPTLFVGIAVYRLRIAQHDLQAVPWQISAADFDLLVGATGQSVYAWEAGKSKPKPKNLIAIAALRGVGKREVAHRLANLKS